ncbi:unnamed protein product [Meloidogyne enterolobii]|uniref:Uncharacterized protein n=1 Tax=Meloidogyne enterolobii TaxID=390850 RepID=A0ACB0ZWH2_MELEN
MIDQEKLQEILLSKDQQKIADFLLKLRDQRRLDELFQAILELLQKSSVSEFSISQLILNEFVVYFRELSPLVSFEYSKLLLNVINSLGNGKKMLKSLVVILRLLIENIPLLSARQTRDLIKSDQMIEICSQFWNSGNFVYLGILNRIDSSFSSPIFPYIFANWSAFLISTNPISSQAFQNSIQIFTNTIGIPLIFKQNLPTLKMLSLPFFWTILRTHLSNFKPDRPFPHQFSPYIFAKLVRIFPLFHPNCLSIFTYNQIKRII